MKLFAMLLLLLTAPKNCGDTTAAQLRSATVEYEAVSRGMYLNIVAADNKLRILDKRDGSAREYTPSKREWEELTALFSALEPEKIASYEAPTQKRFYDGAAIANLKVMISGNTYEAQTFDHGTPAAPLAAFVNKLVALAKQ